MTLDATFRPLTQALVAKFGAPATLSHTTGGTYDPVTGTSTGSTTTDTSIKVSPPENYSIGVINGTSVQTGDLHCIVAALDATLVIGDSIEIDSVTFTVISSNPIYSGAQVCAYDVQLRR